MRGDTRNVIRRRQKTKPFVARDGALIWELFRPANSRVKNMSVAAGFLKPAQKAFPHLHKRSEEIYYVLAGAGRVRVGNNTYTIKKGDAIYIPRHSLHALMNTSRTKRLEILAISSPAYTDLDIFFNI